MKPEDIPWFAPITKKKYLGDCIIVPLELPLPEKEHTYMSARFVDVFSNGYDYDRWEEDESST